jgi:hypothetical protein
VIGLDTAALSLRHTKVRREISCGQDHRDILRSGIKARGDGLSTLHPR